MCQNAGVKREIQQFSKAKTFLSSVECGPNDIGKAKEMLGFVPTSLEEAIKETDFFYDKA